MKKMLQASHGIICRKPNERLGYFGWPTVARLDDGTLAVASSGLRSRHVCPYGKTVLNTSSDEGRTWSVPRPLGFHGAPAHLLRHSSGVLVLSYSYRRKPYGQRIAFSRTDGATWDHHWILRADGPSWDLGYPSTVERPDGTLYTV